MTFLVTSFPNGPWKQNCYIVSNPETRAVLLIDPGSDAPYIEKYLLNNDQTPIAILNTHAHFDHVGAVNDLMLNYKIPFYLNVADYKLLTQANLYKLLFGSKTSMVIPKPTNEFLTQMLKLDCFNISILFTPGHTPGSTCLQIGNNLFSGDTILPNGIGRTDLPGGDKIAMAESIELLKKLPTSITVWPGHGHSFTLGSFWDMAPYHELA
jgi:hydroxyacylglutathione hydrolase